MDKGQQKKFIETQCRSHQPDRYLRLFEYVFNRSDGNTLVSEVTEDREWEITKQLRCEIYHNEMNYISKCNLLDEFDSIATVYNYFYDGRPIGTSRYIDSAINTPEMLQTHPQLYQILPRERHYLEVGRYMVKKKYRNARYTLPVLKHVFDTALEKGVDSIIMSCASPLIPYYIKYGFRLLSENPIDRKYLQGINDYPMAFDFHDNKEWFYTLKKANDTLNTVSSEENQQLQEDAA